MITRNVLSSLRARNEPEYSAVYTSPSEINGKRVEEVAVDFGGQVLTLGIEPNTGRVFPLLTWAAAPMAIMGKSSRHCPTIGPSTE